MKNLQSQLFDFIKNSPTPFHVVDNISKELMDSDFIEIDEKKPYNIRPNKKYFVKRNDSSLIAFIVPENYDGYSIVASHSDAPCFSIKKNPEITVNNKYTKLNVEKYGGIMLSTWFDRPLSVAGRVFLEDNNSIKSKLVNINRDLMIIPNLAIHLGNKSNNEKAYSVQKEFQPIFSSDISENGFMDFIAKSISNELTSEDIIDSDLYLYNRENAVCFGENNEYFGSPKIDDLECAFLTLQPFLNAEANDKLLVYAIFDNEEVGSSTKQGADSNFLNSTLLRINDIMGKRTNDYYANLANSFMLSCDNAHAMHPNYPEKSDNTNAPYMNDGIVIKYNANQKYATDGFSAASLKVLCKKNNIPYQTYANNSDLPGGSTLGSISNTQVSIPTVDIGLAQLAMHSSFETAGSKDCQYLIDLIKVFLEI